MTEPSAGTHDSPVPGVHELLPGGSQKDENRPAYHRAALAGSTLLWRRPEALSGA